MIHSLKTKNLVEKGLATLHFWLKTAYVHICNLFVVRTMNSNEGMLTAALKSEPDSTVIAHVTYILCELS